MRLKSLVGNSARSSIASAAGTTSASTNLATAFLNSSCSVVNLIIGAGALRPAWTEGGPRQTRRGSGPRSTRGSAPADNPSGGVRRARPGSGLQATRGIGLHSLPAPATEVAGRGLVDRQVGAGADDDDAVGASRCLDRYVVVEHVFEHTPGIALERVAVAAGARLLERDDVAVRELARLLAVDDLLARPRVDHRATELPRLAAAETVGRELLPVGEIRQLSLVCEKAQIAADTAAAPERAGAGGIADQLEALDDQRLVGLLRLHRDVGGVERPRHRLAAVLCRAGSRSREHQLVGDEPPLPRAVPATEGRVRHVRGGGRDPVGERRREGAQHRLERPIADDRTRSPTGGGPRVEERALRRRP